MAVISAVVEKELGVREGIVAEAVVPRCPQWLTIPFSSMSQFSLLQNDVEVEEPETSELFEIHNIVWRHTDFGHYNICYMI